MKVQVRLLPMFPLSVVLGGLEIMCVKTCHALNKIDISAKILRYDEAADDYNILHLFASSPNYYDICHHSNRPIIITATSNTRNAIHIRPLIWKGVSWIARIAHIPTVYDRLRDVFHHCTFIICQNQLEADFVRITYDVPSDRIRIIPNGVDPVFYNADPDMFISKYRVKDFVLFSGNLVARKNPLLLAKTLDRMKCRGVFIGKIFPSEQRYGEEFVHFIQQCPHLLWIPGLSHDDLMLASAYAASRVFCLPSSSETQSLSALEAMAAGKPIILGDLPYAYQRPFENALRCNVNEIKSLEHSLQVALEHPEKYAVKLPTSYLWENIARQIAQLYFQLGER